MEPTENKTLTFCYTLKHTLGAVMKAITYLLTMFALLVTTGVQADPVHYNGHYYDRIDTTLTWLVARDQAASMTYAGTPGHLVTILTEEEHNFVNSVRNGGDCWIGAEDIDVEGEWRWVTGEIFWTGGLGGSVVDGMFEAWNNNEPNNSGNEDFAHMFTSGPNAWNDLRATHSRSCYLVEFPVEIKPVPTLGQLGLGSMILLLGMLGWRFIRPV